MWFVRSQRFVDPSAAELAAAAASGAEIYGPGALCNSGRRRFVEILCIMHVVLRVYLHHVLCKRGLSPEHDILAILWHMLTHAQKVRSQKHLSERFGITLQVKPKRKKPIRAKTAAANTAAKPTTAGAASSTGGASLGANASAAALSVGENGGVGGGGGGGGGGGADGGERDGGGGDDEAVYCDAALQVEVRGVVCDMVGSEHNQARLRAWLGQARAHIATADDRGEAELYDPRPTPWPPMADDLTLFSIKDRARMGLFVELLYETLDPSVIIKSKYRPFTGPIRDVLVSDASSESATRAAHVLFDADPSAPNSREVIPLPPSQGPPPLHLQRRIEALCSTVVWRHRLAQIVHARDAVCAGMCLTAFFHLPPQTAAIIVHYVFPLYAPVPPSALVLDQGASNAQTAPHTPPHAVDPHPAPTAPTQVQTLQAVPSAVPAIATISADGAASEESEESKEGSDAKATEKAAVVAEQQAGGEASAQVGSRRAAKDPPAGESPSKRSKRA